MSHTTPPAPQRAVVIGSGFGGLALAVRLQAAGVQTTILEKREKIGGRAYQLVDQDYVFDMGPSLVTSPGIVDSIFQAAGRSLHDYVEMIPLDPYYRIYFHDGTHLDYVGDAERMKAQMACFNEGDAQRFDDFMAAVEPIHEAVIGDRLGSKPFDTVKSMVDFVPQVIKMGAWRPVYSFVSKYFEDFRHRFIYSFHPLFVGGNPFSAPSVYLMIPYLEREGGVWFTRGGMYALVEALGRLFQELGGEIRTDHEVTSIRVENGRAVGAEAAGQYFGGDIVVSNGDVGHTYKHLIAPEHRKHWTDGRVERQSYTMSCFLLYLGVRKQYPQLEHHTLILAERYKGLIRDIFKKKILPDDFSMYVHAPTRTDPGMAPEGCESMYVLIPVANNQSGIDWSALKDRFTDTVLDFLEEWGLEGLRENLDVLHVMTPDDFTGELNAMYGNAFGVEPKLTQTAYFRPQNRSEDIEGLYLVGAGTHPGAGVPGVMLSAETTYGCIARDLGLPDQWDWNEKGSVRFGPGRGLQHDEALAARRAGAVGSAATPLASTATGEIAAD
ncbi:MAG: phytoene desaturase [Gemmatimonadales bacterium]|jgi:phytoene desaturase|nr:MAG: phytoene desaturase [Gemmatimonadales bacterium]